MRRATPFARDVIIAFFDAEEPPYFLGAEMGSTRLLVDVLLPAREHVIPIVLEPLRPPCLPARS